MMVSEGKVPDVHGHRLRPDAGDCPVTVPSTVVPFAVVGVVAIVSGGLIAAVTEPLAWQQGAWVAAFLVLVVGVGQIGLALGQATFGGSSPTTRTVMSELAFFNVGAALVVVGTLLSSPATVTAGSAAFATALGVFAHNLHHPRGTAWSRIVVALLLVLAVSVPIGVGLSWLGT